MRGDLPGVGVIPGESLGLSNPLIGVHGVRDSMEEEGSCVFLVDLLIIRV